MVVRVDNTPFKNTSLYRLGDFIQLSSQVYDLEIYTVSSSRKYLSGDVYSMPYKPQFPGMIPLIFHLPNSPFALLHSPLRVSSTSIPFSRSASAASCLLV